MNRRKKIETFKYSTVYINIISLIIALIVFFNINLFLSNFNLEVPKQDLEIGTEVKNENPNENNKKVTEENSEWYLEIPSIGLNAPIAEGTDNDVLDKYVGHFGETVKDNGNIGLVAHNRGYQNNYFENAKNLKKGDVIIYHYGKKTVKFIIEIITIIKDTDWNYLKPTEDNRITLITCVENQPEYRRCIQGKEMEEI